MPRRDGTGPQSMGPMTGRGLGLCGEYPNVRYSKTHTGRRGCGMGFGGGRGWGRGMGYGRRSDIRQDIDYDSYQANSTADFAKEAIAALTRQVESMSILLKELKSKVDKAEDTIPEKADN